MGAFEDLFEMATKESSREVSHETSYTNMTGLTRESTNIAVLDYIALQLCECLDSHSLAFQGGYVLNKIIKGDLPRSTMDIDVSIEFGEYYEDVKKVLKSVGESLVSDGIFSSYEVDEAISVEWCGGLNLHCADGSRNKLGVDVGVRDFKSGLVPLNIGGLETNRFSAERMLADKLFAIFTPKRLRRVKDLYDVYIITNCFDISMDELYQHISSLGGLDWNNSPVKAENVEPYRKAYGKLRVRRDEDNDPNIHKPQFDELLSRVIMFTVDYAGEFKWDCKLRRMIK